MASHPNSGSGGGRGKGHRDTLEQNTSSTARGIAGAQVVKNEDLAFLCQPNGNVPLSEGHGFGLYYHDCRYLDGYELALAGRTPEDLVATGVRGYMAEIELTNPEIDDGGEKVPKDTLGLHWERILSSEHTALLDVLVVRNFGPRAVEVPLELRFRSRFEDIFVVRGMAAAQPGKLHDPRWAADDLLYFRYDGKDGVHRALSVGFSRAPEKRKQTTASFRLRVEPQAEVTLEVTLTVQESRDPEEVQPHSEPQERNDLVRSGRRKQDRWQESNTSVESGSWLLNRVLERSLQDLRTLRSRIDGHRYYAAGVPWFITLFGRDSLISSLQTLAFNRDVPADTLRALAHFQGTEVDDWRAEQPGRIVHEVRVGELANLGRVPSGRYYGTIDAPVLFLVLLARHAGWTGSLDLFHELREPVERILKWTREYGDLDGDGYLEYRRLSKGGLYNQGWKDSGDAIVCADGSLAPHPIALVEVQGYFYLAQRLLAGLFRRAGEAARADELERSAAELKARFNRDYWMEDEGFYALALVGEDKAQARVVSSNPGQALWTGIVADERADRVRRRLVADDMYGGWGVRTLSRDARRFNPVGYHLGSVWPHDNSIIAAGLRRYGFHREAERIFTDLVEASGYFPGRRLPELFAGFPRERYDVPVRYPVACHPQAWAAGSVPFLLTTALGLEPDAFEKRLRVVQPWLPHFVDGLVLRDLRVGQAHVDLRFRRAGHGGGRVGVEVTRCEGDLEVETVAAADDER